MKAVDYTGDPKAILCHFNPNHDPRNGQFTRKHGSKYQNPDGTLTAKGEARFEAEKKKNALKKKENRVKDVEDLKDPSRWEREDTENVKGVVDASGKLIDELKRTNQSLNSKKKKKFDLSNMSDSDLRQMINRMQMEEQYSRLVENNGKEVSTGKAFVDGVLSYAGTAITLTSSALSIALAIQKLRTP